MRGGASSLHWGYTYLSFASCNFRIPGKERGRVGCAVGGRREAGWREVGGRGERERGDCGGGEGGLAPLTARCRSR